MKILVIEDNEDIAASVYEYLSAEGHIMDAAADGVTGLHLAVTNDYDVIVLDLGLPGINGLDLCRRLRNDARQGTPILMLTARDSLEDKVEGFDAGADDYLVKPFALVELAARVNALGQRPPRDLGRVMAVEDLVMDLDLHEVRRADQKLNLNPTAFQILEYLMRNTHRAVKKQELEEAVWQDDPPDSDSLRTHISNLRQIVDKPFERNLVHTIRGYGYRLSEHVQDSAY